ncbi:MAG: DUF1566 domain-containing protein [Deltaproteobacteria bacterium]|nr:DUF1566 domain-containing protein [Deltaproteobacteria bacterium]
MLRNKAYHPAIKWLLGVILILPIILGGCEKEKNPSIAHGDVIGQTSENGDQATFWIRLVTPPKAEVQVPIKSSDPGEGIATPSSLTFKTSNWDQPQTVTVTGQKDYIADGDQPYSIEIGPSKSNDPEYNDLITLPIELINKADDQVSNLVAFFPPTNSIDAAKDTTIRLNFGKAIDSSLVTAQTTGITCSGSVQLTGNNFFSCLPMNMEILSNGDITTYVFTPITPLQPSNYYHIKIGSTIISELDSKASMSSLISGFSTFFDFLPDTGQSTTYILGLGDDSDYVINSPSFTDSIWGKVTDNITGLTWQQADDGQLYNFSEANAYCENSTLAFYKDWRLPSLIELVSIVDYQNHNPSIDLNYFPGTQAAKYHSSSTDSVQADYSWSVNFPNGAFFRQTTSDQTDDSKAYVRCVRKGEGGHLSTNNYQDNQDGTILDRKTGLLWAKEISDDLGWEEAISYCESLNLGKLKDWRTPNIKELASILDVSKSSLSQYAPFEFNGSKGILISSTTYSWQTEYKWVVHFTQARGGRDLKTVSRPVRCVRGGYVKPPVILH